MDTIVFNAIRLSYDGVDDELGALVHDIAIEDCIVEDSYFTSSAVSSSARPTSTLPSPEDYPVSIVSITRTVFNNNDYAGRFQGMLAFSDYAQASVTDSCFIDNIGSGNVSSIVYVGNSTLGTIEGNYGSGNAIPIAATRIKVSSVDGIYFGDLNKCSIFEAPSCVLDTTLTGSPVAPTSSPSTSPSMRPSSSGAPSMSFQPSTRPSASSQPSASFVPSSSPSLSISPSSSPSSSSPTALPTLTKRPIISPTKRPTVSPTDSPVASLLHTRRPTIPRTSEPTAFPQRRQHLDRHVYRHVYRRMFRCVYRMQRQQMLPWSSRHFDPR